MIAAMIAGILTVIGIVNSAMLYDENSLLRVAIVTVFCIELVLHET